MSLACIAHKSLEICERCRLRELQAAPPAECARMGKHRRTASANLVSAIFVRLLYITYPVLKKEDMGSLAADGVVKL
jgi:hypothetical protein